MKTIKEIRKANGLTQRDLAELQGITREAVAMADNGPIGRKAWLGLLPIIQACRRYKTQESRLKAIQDQIAQAQN